MMLSLADAVLYKVEKSPISKKKNKNLLKNSFFQADKILVFQNESENKLYIIIIRGI